MWYHMPMGTLWVVLNIFLGSFPGQALMLSLFMDRLRFRKPALFVVYAIFYSAAVGGLLLLGDRMEIDFQALQRFRIAMGVVGFILPFLVIKEKKTKLYFVYLICAVYMLTLIRLSHFIDLRYFGGLIMEPDYSAATIAILCLNILTMPPMLWFMHKIVRPALKIEHYGEIWRYICIVPLLFFSFNLVTSSLSDMDNLTGVMFLPSTLMIFGGTLASCYPVLKIMRLATDNAALGRASSFKTDFMRTISHEMRTPLAVIMGYAEITAEDVRKSGPQSGVAANLDIIAAEAGRMADMMEEMRQLALAKEYSKDRRPVDLGAVIGQIARLYSKVLERKGTVLELRVESGELRVLGSENELIQVLFNLLRNADRHTEGGVIEIRADFNDSGELREESGELRVESGELRAKNTVAVTVTDNGTGIAPGLLPRVFERGVHGEGGGTGFGLAICRDIITAYGGEISIESEPGKGTSVTFALPAAKRVES